MTFTAYMKDRFMFYSDKEKPQRKMIEGVIKPRDKDCETLNVTLTDGQGKTSKGILKRKNTSCWEGKSSINRNNPVFMKLNYNDYTGAGYMNIYSKKKLINPYTKKMDLTTQMLTTPVKIGKNKIKPFKKIFENNIFFQKAADKNSPDIKGRILSTQQNGVYKIQFTSGNEFFNGETSVPMRSKKFFPFEVLSMGNAIGDKGSSANFGFLVNADGSHSSLCASIQGNNYQAWNTDLKKRKVKTNKKNIIELDQNNISKITL